MSKFDFMSFGSGAGYDDMFVVSARKHTVQQVVEIFKREYDYKIKRGDYREPVPADVQNACCAFRFGVSMEWPDGCYTFVSRGERGAFPVHVICFEKLKLEGAK